MMTPLRRHVRTRSIAATAGVLLALTATACGGTQAAPAASENGLTTVRLGNVQLSDYAAVLLGVDQGIFERNGLNIELVDITPADLVGGLLSGQVDMNPNTGPGTVMAAGKGIPLAVVGGVSTFEAGPDGRTGSTLLVEAGSPIRTAADLEGKTVGVNLLASASEYGVRGVVDQAGGDGSDVSVIEVPFSAMGESLTADRIDAALVGDPYASLLLKTGQFEAPIGDPIEQVFGPAPRVVVTGTRDYVETNPEVVDKFRTALDESVEYADSHPDDMRAAMVEHFGTPADTVGDTGYPALESRVDAAGLDDIATILRENGALDSSADISGLTR